MGSILPYARRTSGMSLHGPKGEYQPLYDHAGDSLIVELLVPSVRYLTRVVLAPYVQFTVFIRGRQSDSYIPVWP